MNNYLCTSCIFKLCIFEKLLEVECSSGCFVRRRKLKKKSCQYYEKNEEYKE